MVLAEFPVAILVERTPCVIRYRFILANLTRALFLPLNLIQGSLIRDIGREAIRFCLRLRHRFSTRPIIALITFRIVRIFTIRFIFMPAGIRFTVRTIHGGSLMPRLLELDTRSAITFETGNRFTIITRMKRSWTRSLLRQKT